MSAVHQSGRQDHHDNNVHMIYDRRKTSLNQGPAMKGIEAYRMMDTVVAQRPGHDRNCKYADIVLRLQALERFGDLSPAYRETIVWFSRVVEPLFECRAMPRSPLGWPTASAWIAMCCDR